MFNRDHNVVCAHRSVLLNLMMLAALGLGSGINIASADSPATQPTSGAPTTAPSSSPTSFGPKPLLTMPELKQLMDDKKFAKVDSEVTRIYSLMSGVARDKYDRYDLLVLRAEARIRLQQKVQALKDLSVAYDTANKASNKEGARRAAALAFLINNSNKMMYTPKSGEDKAPLDLADESIREKCFKALYADEIHALEDADWKSKSNVSIGPIVQIAERYEGLRAVEFVVNGNNAETDGRAKGLASWSSKMIDSSFSRMTDTLTRLSVKANKFEGKTRIGLTQEEKETVMAIGHSCEQMPQLLQTLNAAFADPLTFEWVPPVALDIRQAAKDVLEGEQPHFHVGEVGRGSSGFRQADNAYDTADSHVQHYGNRTSFYYRNGRKIWYDPKNPNDPNAPTNN